MVPQGKGGNKTLLTQVLVPVGLYLNKAQNVGEEASAVADLLSLGPRFPHSLILTS
ncbi:unnamed protein product [Brassica oleracea var. botrytis]